jgi:hypothetical protein
LPIVLLVEGEQVVGHELHGGVVFLLLQGFHAGDPGVGRISWVYE